MSHVPHFHIWLPSGRTLCDRFGRAASDEELSAFKETLRPCGACLLAADFIRSDSLALVAEHGQPDITPDEAVQLLADLTSGWGNRMDADYVRELLKKINYDYPQWVDPEIANAGAIRGKEDDGDDRHA